MTFPSALPATTPDPAEALRWSPVPLPMPHVSQGDTFACGIGSVPAAALHADHVGEGLTMSNDAIGAWECAVQSFALAWRVPAKEWRALRTVVDTPTRCLDALVGRILAEAAALAFATERPDLAHWCWRFCEAALTGGHGSSGWQALAPPVSVVDDLAPLGARGLSNEALVWWCLDLRPSPGEEGEAGTTPAHGAYALYLAVRAAEAFVASKACDRERAGVLAVLGTIVARQSVRQAGAA